MSQAPHTYGPTCHLARVVSFSGSKGDDDIPDLKAHFFYSSALPIDDPLSPVPTYTSYDSWTGNYPPRPFSIGDNHALEDAWLRFASDKDRKHHNRGKSPIPVWRRHTERHSTPDDQHGAKKNKMRSSDSDIGASLLAAPIVIPLYAGGTGAQGQPAYTKSSTGHEEVLSSPLNSDVDKKIISKEAKTSDTVHDATDGADETEHNSSDQVSCSQTIQEEPKYRINPNNTYQHQPDVSSDQPVSTPHSDAVNDSQTRCNHDSSDRATHQEISENSEIKSHGPLDHGNIKAVVPQKEVEETQLAEEISEAQSLDQAQGDAASDNYLRKMFRGKSRERDTTAKPKLGTDSSEFDGKEQENNKHRNTLDQHGSEEVAGSPISSGLANLPAKDREAGITGAPFAKLPSHRDNIPNAAPNHPTSDNLGSSSSLDAHSRDTTENSPGSHDRDSTETETLPYHGCRADKNTSKHVEVPVGISRLHLVKLPILQMEPIYWSPVHDICAVTRGTWFYRDTMCPVEPAVANQLEMGYRELRPWSGTWNDELNSAMEVGAAGEEKISHRLWPEDDQNVTAISMFDSILSTNPYCAARCFHGEAAAEGSVDVVDNETSSKTKTISKKYPNSQVIYKDSRNAFILKPSLLPSEYYGRKPLQKIRKGITVGIHVVRGFDWKAWEKLHPSKKPKVAVKAEEHVPVGGNGNGTREDVCAACLSTNGRPKVTDLVLVIHGIGQKLSERVESFHFTHAINSFRRSVNVDLESEPVKKVLRNDHGGIMVLPINWRADLSFEDGGPLKGDENHQDSNFSLKDITPNSIPAVRNIISDVMLDIPFYMSHHKPKMIQAVIREANRVYRLWCKNNPDFHKEGRVHVIAHSLGSVMAVEILSKQPTSTPKTDVSTRKLNAKNFDFKTTNLFLVGSPAGFFLLLEKGHLTPRLGQNKPCAEYADDNDKAIVGNAGTFGCVAVDNIYNVMDVTDPIAYCLNATADAQYAASLKNAQVPSATTSFFESIGNAVKSITPGVPKPNEIPTGQVGVQPPLQRLPSQLEMEVHDFTREEMAEKKFHLLNDNGQIDWFLNSGGGPLDIQYLNMLGAHSSYWTSQDFIRMMVTELGRKPGKQHTIPNMRAVKVVHKPGTQALGRDK